VTPPETIYRGGWGFNSNAMYGPQVTCDGESMPAPTGPWGRCGFAWGYAGAGPLKLAYAIVLHATGDKHLALKAYRWFLWATVVNWGSTWSITAHQVRVWLDQFERESKPGGARIPACGSVRRCRSCGCTEDDCSSCVEATGYPCSWVAGEEDLCTRCANETHAVVALVKGSAA
jgi:hypothetical protein